MFHDGFPDSAGEGTGNHTEPTGDDSPPAFTGREPGTADLLASLTAAVDALRLVDGALPAFDDRGLTELMALADQVAASASAARVASTAEAVWRNLPHQDGRRTPAWVRDHAPHTRQAGAHALARLAQDAAHAARASRPGDGSAGPPPEGEPPRSAVTAGQDPESPLGIVWKEVVAGRVGVPLAWSVLRQIHRVAPHLEPESVPLVTESMIEVGVEHGPTMVEALRARLVAEHGRPGDLDELHEKLATSAFLSQPQPSSVDLTDYALALSPTQVAILEAAIDALAAPRINAETGETDLRGAGQRRAEALIEVCAQAIARGGQVSDGSDSTSLPTATVTVTVPLEDLETRLGCGEVGGSRAFGTLLPPDQIRQLACDAQLIPAVLGSAGEIIDWGRAVRLFSKVQRRVIWHRDRHCTYPGCTAPPSWSRVHHIRHWLDDGPSDVTNGTLLCQYHHTIVHQRRLWAVVLDEPDVHRRSVIWDLRPGSYDVAIADPGSGPSLPRAG